MPRDPVAEYLPQLVAGELDAVLATFRGEPHIDDPVGGHAFGQGAVLALLAERHEWLQSHNAQVETLRVTEGRERADTASVGYLCIPPIPVSLSVPAGRTVTEIVVRLVVDGRQIGLPVAVAGEVDDDGKLNGIRVYHSLWPILGRHEVRPPILQTRHDLAIPDVVGKYQRALAEGDLDTMLEVFEDDGTVREPSGEPYVYHGKDQIREIYTHMFASHGGIPLEHCSVTDDGTACAIEYSCARWGQADIPPQAGIAVYERGERGKLAAARIYDDVEPPAESDTSKPPSEP